MSNFWTLKRKIGFGLIGILFLLDFFVWKEVFAIAGPHYLKVDVLNIGQGDSIFIETPSMRRILIDGGPNSSVLGKLAKRMPLWSKSLDVVILTHPDADHVIGLLHVLKKYEIDYIIWTGMIRDGGNYQEWISLLEKKQNEGSKIIIVKLNDQIKTGNVALKILHPFENLTGHFFDKQGNDTGIVTSLQYGKKSFLFTADASNAVEQGLINYQVNLDSDVLKIGHHGSKYSTSEEFLQAVSPDIAVISVGKNNSYGHPTQEVLQKLQEFGIKVLRTDTDGDVQIVSDGENIIVNVSENEHEK